MAQPIFDAGAFCLIIIIGFILIVLSRKVGAVLFAGSVVLFMIAGLVVVTGNDVAFTKLTIPANVTSVAKNNTSGITITTTMTKITATNETDYLIGNSQFPIYGTTQLVLGWSFFMLAIICGVIFLDQTLKGNLLKGD